VQQKTVSDWDFTTNAEPEEIQTIFPEHFYENTFGTVGVSREHLWQQVGLNADQLTEHEKDDVYEITTFRSESAYSDHRRPDSVEWGKTLADDLVRRDFTMNAMALDIPVDRPFSVSDSPPTALTTYQIEIEAKLIDPHQGAQDLQQGLLRAVGDANVRFTEDALRMLRAIRLAAQLSLRLDMDILIALQQNAALIQHVAWERIRDEFLKTIVTDRVEDALTLLATTGILQHLFPELLALRGVEQRGHHEHDVWTHSVRACATCPSRDPIVRLVKRRFACS
jgi:tRNA nucleotidyltransferase/poly(A) polymerase